MSAQRAVMVPAAVPAAVAAAVAAAWATLVVAEATGSRLVDHDALAGGGADVRSVGLFLLGWLVMVAATMLPSNLPAVRDVVTHGTGVHGFLVGFGAVWGLFGWAALGLDAAVHGMVDTQPWLAARPGLVAAGLLAVVGAMQFSPPKRRCLDACRVWSLPRPPSSGRGAMVIEGVRYGRLCLGCDGGLMLLMFAAGGTGVTGMAALGLVMAAERTAWLGGAVHRWVGAVLLAAGAVVVGSAL